MKQNKMGHKWDPMIATVYSLESVFKKQGNEMEPEKIKQTRWIRERLLRTCEKESG